MLQSNNIYKYTFMPLLACLLFFTLLLVYKSEARAAVGFEYYSYDKIYEKLPKKYQTSDYIYMSNGIPLIAFAQYGDTDYKTSIKKSDNKNNFIYCCDYSKHIVFEKSYTAKNGLFNNKLRARIGTAFYNGTTQWGKKASSQFTTGNFITDYYMTQIVVHALIYKYGGALKLYGIDYDKLTFKKNTDTLKKKTKELFDYCCKSEITLTDGNFQNPQFSLVKPTDNQLKSDNTYFYSDYVSTKSKPDGATVKTSTEVVKCTQFSSDVVELEHTTDAYDSDFRIKVPISYIESLEPGVVNLSVVKVVDYTRDIAGFWQSTNKENQETAGIITNQKSISDTVDFKIVIGNVSLVKRDSFTGEIIKDATFSIYQKNDKTGEFEFYKNMEYNANTGQYESGNLYASITNATAAFQIRETQPAPYYKNDWAGTTFNITEEYCQFKMEVENEPYFGSLIVNKKGEQLKKFEKNEFIYDNPIPLEGITYSLYADNDIYKRDQCLFTKGQHIVDFVTDKNGKAVVRDLPLGEYYFKETKTLDMYQLDSQEYHFAITRDSSGKYLDKEYDLLNVLKKCKINLYKKYEEDGKKYPLAGARFGLYCSNPIYDVAKKTILEKDSLIGEKTTNEKGELFFSNLPYADYYLKELEAPEGYILNDGIIAIKKNEFEPEKPVENEKNFAHYKKDIEAINQKQYYSIKLYKYGESFIDAVKQNSDNGEYFQYNMKSNPLEHVVFALYTEQDELVDKKETDKDGVVLFSGLKAGKYYYIEESCPEMYEKDSAKHEVDIKPGVSKFSGFYEDEAQIDFGKKKQPLIEENVYNAYCKVSLPIRKQGETAQMSESGIRYEIIPLSNVVFGIYQNFEYTFSSGEKLPKDTCVGYLVTREDGTATFQGKLPEGQYYVKEIKTLAGYDIDENLYYFDIKANNHKALNILMDNQNIFVNRLSKSSVQITKTDADTGKTLKGVEFTLYNQDGQSIGVYKTDKHGKISIVDLPYGNYYFVESKAKHGYYATNNKYKFTLDSAEGVVLNITNAPILKLGFEEHYKMALIAIIVLIICFGSVIGLNYIRINRS